MTTDSDFQAYLAALRAVIDLPAAEAAEIDEIHRRCRAEVNELDRARRDVAQRWTGFRDESARLSRRINDLAGKVGAAPAAVSTEGPLEPGQIEGAMERLRADVERTDQSWQWVLRHRQRQAMPPTVQAVAPPPQPAHTPPPPPVPVASNKSTIDPKIALLGIALVVLAALILVVVMVG